METLMKKEANIKIAYAIVAGIAKKFPKLFHKGKYYGRNLTDDQISQLKWNRWHKKGGPSPKFDANNPYRLANKIKVTEPWWGYKRPFMRQVRDGAGVGVVGYGGGSVLLSNSVQGDGTPLTRTSAEPTTTGRSPLSGTQSALVGGTVGGLGSLLYGTLADKPDLRRDLIATLIGGASGGAYHLLTQEFGSKKPVKQVTAPVKQVTASVLDKEAVWPVVAGTLGYFGGDLTIGALDKHWQRKEQRRHNDIELALQQYQIDHQLAQDAEALEAFKNKTTAMSNLTTSQKAQRLGAGGALAGGALGGLLSSAFGKVTDRESMRRDIISMLGGAAIGGTAGVLSGDPSLIPDWARSAADKVRSTADKVRSSVSDRLSQPDVHYHGRSALPVT